MSPAVAPFRFHVSSSRQRCRPIRSVSEFRRGAAIVEFAVLLPILMLVLLGATDICSMIRTQQRLNTLAYESARIAVTPETTMTHVQQQCTLICNENQLQNVAITTNPQSIDQVQSGQWLDVTVTAPFAENSLLGGWILPNLQLSETVSLQRP